MRYLEFNFAAIPSVVVCGLVLSSGMAGAQAADPEASEAGAVAVVTFQATEGFETGGKLILAPAENGIELRGKITGLSPGSHGFHIHENGACSGAGAQGAGGHFAPDGNPHGSPDSPPSRHHAGDLGNIVADQSGEAVVAISDAEIGVVGPDSVLGRSIIVHAREDDLTSQPAGAAGPRVACGVIVALARKPEWP